MMKRETKRLLVTVMASTLLSTAAFTAMATKSYAEQEKTQTTLKGDTDGDGKITITDAYNIRTLAEKVLNGDANDLDVNIYDVDGNGSIDRTDAKLTMEYVTKVNEGYKNLIWPPVNGSIYPSTTSTTTEVNAKSHFSVGQELVFIGVHWNIRNSKDLNSDNNIVGALEKGSEFKILAVENDEWYYIKSNNTFGYVNLSKYWNFATKKQVTTTTTIATATTEKTTTTKATATTEKKITTARNDKSKFVAGQTLVFTGTHWNVRNAKDLENDKNIIGALTKDSNFKILLDESNGWYLIKTGSGIIGYVNLSQYWYFKVQKQEELTTCETTTTVKTTTTTKATTTTEKTTTTTEKKTTVAAETTKSRFLVGETLVFKGEKWNIRSEKNLENDKNVIGVLEPSDEFDILSAEGEEWYQINSNGRVGYVNLSQYWNFYSKCLKSVAATARNA